MDRIACLALALGLMSACHGPATAAPPPWARDETAGLDPGVVLVGVASARGSGPEAADAAKRKALGRLVEQIIADVSSESTLTSRERATLRLDDREQDEPTREIVLDDERDRLVRITGDARVIGVRYDVAVVEEGGADGERTYARAFIDRNELAQIYASEVRAALDLARSGLLRGRTALMAGSSVVDAVLAATRGWAALEEPRAILPVVAGLRPSAGPAAGLIAEYGALREQLGATLEELRRRLVLQVDGAPLAVSLAGRVEPFALRALWDGAPLPGLPVAVQTGETVSAAVRTDAEGRATLALAGPATRTHPPRLVVVAVDGASFPLARPELSFPSTGGCRVAVVARHRVAAERPASSGLTGRQVEPSPLGAPLEELLGRLGFAVAPPAFATELLVRRDLADEPGPAALAALDDRLDYLLLADTVSFFSSRTDVATSGQAQPLALYWYQTTGQVRLVEIPSGETLGFTLDGETTKAAGRSAEHAAQRSSQQAVLRLTEGDESLRALLASRFAGVPTGS